MKSESARTLRFAGVAMLWLGLSGAALAVSPTAPVPPFASHRAVYDLSLDSGLSSDTVSDAEGRMVYDFAGSACEGYTTRLRFVTRVSDEDGNSRLTDVATTTFEDIAGSKFDFSTKSFIDGTVSEDTIGSAEREGSKLKVTIEKPKSRHFEIAPSFRFPNQHLAMIIEAAVRGEHFLQIDLFDGSERGEKSYATSAVIGAPNSGADDFGDEATARLAGLTNVRYWPVTVSYFDGPAQGEQEPAYELSFIVYENGVTRRMRLDYGDFALKGKLVKLDMAPGPADPKDANPRSVNAKGSSAKSVHGKLCR